MKKLLATLLALMLVLTASFACAEGLTIGYSTKTITNDAFQLSLHDAIKAAVEANGDTFVSVIAESQTAVATQVSQIEDLINQGVDGLLVNPWIPTPASRCWKRPRKPASPWCWSIRASRPAMRISM